MLSLSTMTSSQCMLRGQEKGELDPGDITLSRGVLLQAALESWFSFLQQILHRTSVLCFAFTDGLLLKRGKGTMRKSYPERSHWVCFLKLRSHFFFCAGLFQWAVEHKE